MTTRNQWIHELATQRGISVKSIDSTLKRGGGVIVKSSLTHIEEMRDESLRLFVAGEILASMWAGQAAWEAAASLAYAIGDLSLHRAQWRRVAGGIKGAKIRREENGGAPIRDSVIAAIKVYKGNESSMASVIAKRIGCDPRYVRKIKTELPYLSSDS